jgi:DNA-binding transcriptional LysR family regulator
MKKVHFSNLDLNLLRVFEALMEERSVTRAGERLGLTQSAVSHALNRLRTNLDDDLFVRTSEGMRPTPWALEAGPQVSRALQMMQRALSPSVFDPATSDRRFALGMSPYLSSVLAPGLVHRFRTLAPRAELVLRHQEKSITEALDAGRVDVAIGAFGRSSDRFDRCVLFQEQLVWVMRKVHPLADKELTLERLAGEPHLIISATGSIADMDTVFLDNGLERRVIWDDDGAYLGAMSRAGRKQVTGMTAPDSITALAIAAETDILALVPMRMARHFGAAFSLVIKPPPYEARPFDICALWRRDQGGHPAVGWLIDLLQTEGQAV